MLTIPVCMKAVASEYQCNVCLARLDKGRKHMIIFYYVFTICLHAMNSLWEHFLLITWFAMIFQCLFDKHESLLLALHWKTLLSLWCRDTFDFSSLGGRISTFEAVLSGCVFDRPSVLTKSMIQNFVSTRCVCLVMAPSFQLGEPFVPIHKTLDMES